MVLREAAIYRVTSLSIIKQAAVEHYTDHESDCSISRRCIYCTFQNNYAILHVGVWAFPKYIDQIATKMHNFSPQNIHCIEHTCISYSHLQEGSSSLDTVTVVLRV